MEVNCPMIMLILLARRPRRNIQTFPAANAAAHVAVATFSVHNSRRHIIYSYVYLVPADWVINDVTIWSPQQGC